MNNLASTLYLVAFAQLFFGLLLFFSFDFIFLLQLISLDTVFTRVSARGAHSILSFQRGALIQGRQIYKKDIKILLTCLFNQTIKTVIITEK